MDIFVVGHNHIDPIWRRGFRRKGHFNGEPIQPAMNIISVMFDVWLSARREGYTWAEGQAAILREYLEMHPEKERDLRAAVQDGTLEVVNAGESVQDSNLPAPEALIRNFLVARNLYRRLGADKHESLKIAWVEDAFGHTPNFPQILAGCGCEVVGGMRYKTPPVNFWIGLDGTRLPVLWYRGKWLSVGAIRLRQPCAVCRGAGCDACRGTGICLVETHTEEELLSALEGICRKFLEQDSQDSGGGRLKPGLAVINAGSDNEVVPIPELPRAIEAVQQVLGGQAKLRFGLFRDVWKDLRTYLEQAMASADEQDFMDLNPVMPGCFVSRIKLKQRTRQLTHRLVRAEADLANAAWIGAGRDGMDALGEMWRNLCLSNFHDAVTGTHIDTAYAELMEIYDRVEATVDDMLGPAPRNHALPARKRADALPQKICLGKFTCSVELGGLRECFFQGHDLFGSAKGTWQQPQWHIGELCLESDFGDAWGRRIPTVGNNTTALGAMHYLVNIDDDRVTWYGTYTGGHKKVRRLDWRTTLVCSDDGKRLDFFLDVWWDTESKRLRAIFPVADGGSEAIWETAFGHVQRTFDPKAINYTLWQADEQEYPAMNWVWKSVPGVGPNAGVALFNRGVPSCRWMPHRFDVSLLRSPESEFCQQEQSNWECWDNDGQRDTGHHRFAFSVWPHVHESTPFELTRAGLAFNDGCVDDLPFDVDGPVTVTCWKPAESGKGCVLRFYETNGKPGEVCLKFQQPVRIQPCNLLEAPTGDAAESNCYAIRLDPFKIHTLIICPVG